MLHDIFLHEIEDIYSKIKQCKLTPYGAGRVNHALRKITEAKWQISIKISIRNKKKKGITKKIFINRKK